MLFLPYCLFNQGRQSKCLVLSCTYKLTVFFQHSEVAWFTYFGLTHMHVFSTHVFDIFYGFLVICSLVCFMVSLWESLRLARESFWDGPACPAASWLSDRTWFLDRLPHLAPQTWTQSFNAPRFSYGKWHSKTLSSKHKGCIISIFKDRITQPGVIPHTFSQATERESQVDLCEFTDGLVYRETLSQKANKPTRKDKITC